MWLWGIIELIIGGLQQLKNSKTTEKWEKFDDFREEHNSAAGEIK